MATPTLLQVRPHGSTGSFTTITPVPSRIKWSVQDISAPDAGRTLDGIMHKERLPMPNWQKRKMELSWNAVPYGSAAGQSGWILQQFTSEYIDVKYPDPQDGTIVEKTFYTGDKAMTFTIWQEGRLWLTEFGFNIIEV